MTLRKRVALENTHWVKQRDGTIRVRCPVCLTFGTLNHEVASNGEVNPSLMCGVEGCDFHEHVTLEGWNG